MASFYTDKQKDLAGVAALDSAASAQNTGFASQSYHLCALSVNDNLHIKLF